MAGRNTLTAAQIRLARAIERAGIVTYSQAVKALERCDDNRIGAWTALLRRREEPLAERTPASIREEGYWGE